MVSGNRDAILDELLRLYRTQKITFEKGLSATDSDSNLGYVSFLENMDNDRGVVKRRLGTRCINDPDFPLSPVLLHEANIAGCPVLFVVNEDRQLYAFIEEFPEKTLKVFKRGFVPLKNGRESDEEWLVFWNRGSRFWAAESSAKLRFLNEFGDTFTINKSGYIQIFDDIKKLTEISLPTHIDNARLTTADSVLYLALEVEDTTHRYCPSVFLTDDSSKNNIPIKGITRFGIENKEGVVGPLSDPPVILNEHKYPFVSVVDAASMNGRFECFGITDSAAPDFNGAYLYRSAEWEATTGEVIQAKENGFLFSDSPPIQINTDAVRKSVLARFAIDLNGNVLMWFDGESVAAAGNQPRLFNGNKVACHPIMITPLTGRGQVRTKDDFALAVNDIDPASFSDYGPPAKTWFKIIGAEVDVDIPLDYAYAAYDITQNNTYTGDLFYVDIDIPGAVRNGYPSAYGMTIELGGIVRPIQQLFTMQIEMRADGDDLYFPVNAFKYNTPRGSGTLLKNKGFDCWEILDNIADAQQYLTVTDVDENFALTLSSNYDLFVRDRTAFWDWMYNGNRFVTWNDGKIIGRSQMAYTEGSTIFYGS